MRVDTAQKLFLGFKLDSEMRRQYADGKLVHRPAFKNGDPARLDILDVKGDLFIGRVVDGGLGSDEITDLERNIKSIVAVTFSVQRPGGALRIYALDRDELATSLAAAV